MTTKKDFNVKYTTAEINTERNIPLDCFTDQLVKLEKNTYGTIESLIRAFGIKVNGHLYTNDEAWLYFLSLYNYGIHLERTYADEFNYNDEFESFELLDWSIDNLNKWTVYGRFFYLDLHLREELRPRRVFDTYKTAPVIESGLIKGQHWQGGKLQNHHATSDGNQRKGQVKLSEGCLVYSQFVKEANIIKCNQTLEKWFKSRELDHEEAEKESKLKFDSLFAEKAEQGDNIKFTKSKRVKPTRDKKGWTEIRVGTKARKLNAGCDVPLPLDTSRIYGSGMYGHYRFTVDGNLLCFQPDKGQLIVVAKIKIDFGEDINRYYLEWLPGVRQLTSEQRENAYSALGMTPNARKKTAEIELSSKSMVPPLLRGVEQAIMWERSKDLYVPPVKREAKPEYYSGKVVSHKNGSQTSKTFRKLKELGISFTKVDKYTLVID